MAKKQSKKQLNKGKCPNVQFFFQPTLKALYELGGSGSNEEIFNKVVAITQLPTDVVDIMHNFTMTEVECRLAWAKTYLKNYGAIENSKHRVWSLTAKGAKMLKENDIDEKDIYDFTAKKRGKETNSSENGVIETESLDWRTQVTDILLNLDP